MGIDTGGETILGLLIREVCRVDIGGYSNGFCGLYMGWVW